MELSAQKLERAKDAAAKAAVELVQDGMLLGLGTGSTAERFVTHLIERCRHGLRVEAVATSKKTAEQARAGGISILDSDLITHLDMTVDGADEIDPQNRMIKGGGGALLREKIVAAMSDEMVVIVDASKLVAILGVHPLPVEIVSFGYRATLLKLEELGYAGALREGNNGKLFVTDNGNYIVDIRFDVPCVDPETIDREIKTIPGVIETGFFINMAGRVIVGHADGKVDVRT